MVTAYLAEYNGGAAYASPSSTQTGDIQLDYGSADVAELGPLVYPVQPGDASYRKQLAVIFDGFAGGSVSSFYLWCEDLSADGVIQDYQGNDTGDRLYYKDTGGKVTSAASDTPLSGDGGSLVPYQKPGAPNIGGGTVTVDDDGTNVFFLQVEVASTSVASFGGLAIKFSYDEVD